MSLDFPDRNKWLAVRQTPAKLFKLLGRLVVTGETICLARNAQKRALGKGRQRVRKRKAMQRGKR